MLTIIRGIPGSGKSTLAKTFLVFEPKTVWVEADMYFFDSTGKYVFDPTMLKAAHEWCQGVVKAAMNRKENCIVSNTFIRNWEMEPYIAMAMKAKCKIKVIECKNSFASIHGVPSEKIQQMKDSWEDIVAPNYKHFDVIQYTAP
jgi:predicted kinase